MTRVLAISIVLAAVLSLPASSDMRFTISLSGWEIEGGISPGAREGLDDYDDPLYWVGDGPRLAFVKTPGQDGWDSGACYLSKDIRDPRLPWHRWQGTVLSAENYFNLSYLSSESYEVGGLLKNSYTYIFFAFPASGETFQFLLPVGTWDLVVWAEPVPEPTSLVCLGAMLLGLIFQQRRK